MGDLILLYVITPILMIVAMTLFALNHAIKNDAKTIDPYARKIYIYLNK